MRKIRLQSFVADYWQTALLALVSMVLLFGFLTYRLGSLTPGFAQSELNYRTSSDSASKIMESPLNAHQKVSNFLIQKLGHHGPAAMRLSSVVIGFVAIICMFLLLRNWHTTRVSLLATTLFATSSWLLHFSRLAMPDIAYLMLIVIFLGAVWLREDKHLVLASLMIVLTSLVFIYVPTMIWFLLPAILWQRKAINATLRSLSVLWQSWLVVLIILALIPLVWSFIQSPDLIKAWLGLPESFVGLSGFANNLVSIPADLFIHRQSNPVFGIGHLPYIDFFTLAMMIMGLFSYAFRIKLDRTKLLFGMGISSSLLIAFGFGVSLVILMPLVYVFAAAGIALMLQQWFTVFPRNPFARFIGVLLITLGVVTAVYYNINSYFVAWPNVPETREIFSAKP